MIACSASGEKFLKRRSLSDNELFNNKDLAEIESESSSGKRLFSQNVNVLIFDIYVGSDVSDNGEEEEEMFPGLTLT